VNRHATGSMLPAVFPRGGTVHIRLTFDADEGGRHVARERITATFLVPTMIYRMLERPAISDSEVDTLRLVIYGAAAMSADRLDQGLRRWGRIFMQLYGQVEAPNTICTLRVADHVPGCTTRLSSCGKPALAIDVGLFDERGVPVPDNAPGEICVRGPLVMDGYLDDPAATMEAFRDGWLRTGDIATRDGDGFLRIVDRRKDMIVSGGFNIFAGDVELALNTHPLVSECAVIGVPDDTWGEAVAAYVVPAGGAVDPAVLIAMCVRPKGAPGHQSRSISSMRCHSPHWARRTRRHSGACTGLRVSAPCTNAPFKQRFRRTHGRRPTNHPPRDRPTARGPRRSEAVRVVQRQGP